MFSVHTNPVVKMDKMFSVHTENSALDPETL